MSTGGEGRTSWWHCTNKKRAGKSNQNPHLHVQNPSSTGNKGKYLAQKPDFASLKSLRWRGRKENTEDRVSFSSYLPPHSYAVFELETDHENEGASSK